MAQRDKALTHDLFGWLRDGIGRVVCICMVPFFVAFFFFLGYFLSGGFRIVSALGEGAFSICTTYGDVACKACISKLLSVEIFTLVEVMS